MLLWMVYASLVAACLCLAASAVEWILRAFRLPARGIWGVALVASIVLPLVGLVTPDAARDEVRSLAIAGSGPGSVQRVADVGVRWTSAVGNRLGSVVAVVWAGTTLLFLALVAAGTTHLARQRRRWRPARIAGTDVLVSATTGPAVIGVARTRIVVPEWVLSLDEPLQTFIIRHEDEHRRARDLWLIAGGLLAVIAFPWNPGLWWQWRRLRLAIEIDCDRRVLRQGGSIESYAELLVRSAEYQMRRLQPVAMALAEPQPSFLERRIDDMTRTSIRSRGARTIVHAVTGMALVVVACDTPIPDAPDLSSASTDARHKVKGVTAIRVADSSGVSVIVRDQVPEAKRPLYVVDGVIVDGDFSRTGIAKADIEKVEVFKGRTAMELFGDRAANGVVQITTHRGARDSTVALHIKIRQPDHGN